MEPRTCRVSPAPRVGTRAPQPPPTSFPSEGSRVPGSPGQRQRSRQGGQRGQTPRLGFLAAPGSPEWQPRQEKVTSNPACAPRAAPVHLRATSRLPW